MKEITKSGNTHYFHHLHSRERIIKNQYFLMISAAFFILIFSFSAQASLVGNNTYMQMYSDPHDVLLRNKGTYMGDAKINGTHFMGNGSAYFDGNGDYIYYVTNSSLTFGSQYTIRYWFNAPSQVCSQGQYCEMWYRGNAGATTVALGRMQATDNKIWHGVVYNSIWYGITSAAAYNDSAWHHAVMIMNMTHIKLYIDSVEVATALSISAPSAITAGSFSIGNNYDNTDRAYKGYIADFVYINRSWTTVEIVADFNNGTGRSYGDAETTAPRIYNVNCTSCNPPLGDNSSPYTTQDTTPTFKFATDEDAWCRIGSENYNYTTMGASRNCSVTGGSSHICTLTTQDQLMVNETDYVYISCKDYWSNENKTSSSGPLEMQITTPQSEVLGRNAIELAMNSSLKNPTIYTDQKVYLRTASNWQGLATFDKLAVYGNKRWGFNYLSGNESYVAFYNLTPVFYFLEMTDLTMAQIVDQVGDLINATKT